MVAVLVTMCVDMHAERSQPHLCNCSGHLLEDSVSGFQPSSQRQRWRPACVVNAHLTRLQCQEEQTAPTSLTIHFLSSLGMHGLTFTVFVHLHLISTLPERW